MLVVALVALAALPALAPAAPAADAAADAASCAGEQGQRLRALLDAGRHDEVVPALESALAACPHGEAAPWTAVPAELFEQGRVADSLEASRLLEKRWPRDAEVLGGKGAALAVLERDEEARIYLEAAVRQAPEDPVHRWNLARLLAYMGRTAEAAAHFATWSSLETDPGRLLRNSCIYATFVERQLGERERACALQRQFCPEPDRSACRAAPAAGGSP